MGTSVLPDWRPQQTLIDLYNEKDQTPGHCKVGATLSVLMLAVGFLIFPSAFIQSYNSTATQSSSAISALVLISLAFTISTSLSFLTKSWLFQLEILYLPHLTSSTIGLISIIHALATHNDTLSNFLPSARYAVTALTISIVSLLVYTILSLLAFRKIYIVRARDAMHRPAPSSKAIGYIPEKEQQRKQLSRLLLQQEEVKVVSPESDTQTTFKIDWPGYNKGQSRRDSMSTLRYMPRSTGTSRYDSRRSSMMGLPADHLTGGIERVSSMIQEEPSRRLPQLINSQRSSMFGPPADHLTGGIERVPTMILEEGSRRITGGIQRAPSMMQRFRSSMYEPPADHLTGGIERVPTMIPDGSTVSLITRSANSAPVSSSTQSSLSVGSGPSPLRPVAYVPPSQAARYLGLESPIEPATPQSALPSYRADAHPSMNISTRPLHRLEQTGFPVEKKEPAIYAMPASEEPRPMQEGPYRMAAPEVMATQTSAGTRSRPEVAAEAMGLSGSILIV